MLRLPGKVSPPTAEQTSEPEAATSHSHAKRFSNATDTSQEAPSIATTTASGQVRRATDDANRETLIAYWKSEQNLAMPQSEAAASEADGLLSPGLQQQRHSWASNRSGARSPGDRRNLSAYRPVAGRWTSQLDDRSGGDGVVEDRNPDAAESFATAKSSPPLYEADSEEVALPLHVPPYNEHRKSGSTPTPLETVEERSNDEQSRHDRSPTRSYRKPVPDHEFDATVIRPSGGDSGGGEVAVSTPPSSPTRRSVLPTHQPQRFSATDSEGMTSSKRTSDQSHFSAATGALHQHVERLRAGPTYQIDEDASHLLGASGLSSNARSTSAFSLNPTPPSPFSQRTSATGISAMQSSPSSQRRGRAWSLSLINKLKNRTRKASDSSLLAAHVQNFGRLDSPSILDTRVETSSSGAAQAVPFTTAARPPLSPLATLRRDNEAAATASATLDKQGPSSDQRSTRRQSRELPGLYAMARRASRKTVPTTAADETEIVTTRAPSGLVAAAVRSPTMQRNFSATSNRTVRRSTSIGSRRSSRSKRSSNGSLRASAGKGRDESRAKDKETTEQRKSSLRKEVQPPPVSPVTPTSHWWLPWSRKNSTSAPPPVEHGTPEDETGWVDEAEDDRGIVSPVAEDPDRLPVQQAGPEKVQQPWAPGWSNRIQHNSEQQDESKANKNPGVQSDTARSSQSDQSQTSHAQTGFKDSQFSSLAPPLPPAPVPPPRKARKGRRHDSGSNRASSSSPNSPVLPKEDSTTSHGSAGQDAREERASSLDIDERRASIGSSTQQQHSNNTGVPTTAVGEAQRAGSTTTDARESLLSDDLDWTTPPSSATKGPLADSMDGEATLQGYRSSLAEARRPRGSVPHSHANLSPVREIMTPESRVMSDDRSGALSAASTFDALTNRRVSSGASMGRHIVMTPTSARDSPGIDQPVRPLPAPSALAEPRTDLASVHRTNSIGSSYGTSTVGGGGQKTLSVSSMKKHTGQPQGSEAAIAAAAVAAVASKQARRANEATDVPGDRRSRSTSMPSKPQSPLSMSSSYEGRADFRTLSPNMGSARGSGLRESWRSSQGPWDGKVVSLGNVVQMPSARGMTRPTVATVRRQRSRSAPLNELVDLNARNAYEHENIDRLGPPTISSASQIDDEAPDAVPFAETAVQASLAALQALEKSEQAKKENDWRARWQSEKLLGFSSFTQPPSSLLPSRHDGSMFVETGYEDGTSYASRGKSAPYTHSKSRSHHRSTRARKQREVVSSSASQGGGAGYESSGLGNGTASESETAASRHRRRRRRAERDKSSLRVGSEMRTGVLSDDDLNQRKRRPDGLPTSSNRVISTAEWDEMVVPAHAKREEEVNVNLLASGLVAPGSPIGPQSPSSPEHTLSMEQQQQQQLYHPVGDTSMATMYDHGSVGRPSVGHKSRPRKSSQSKRREEDSDVGGDDRQSHSRRRNRAGTETGSKQVRRHDKYPTTSTTSLAKSTTKSRIIRKGYGSDDIVAWQASLSIAAALPSVHESSSP